LPTWVIKVVFVAYVPDKSVQRRKNNVSKEKKKNKKKIKSKEVKREEERCFSQRWKWRIGGIENIP